MEKLRLSTITKSSFELVRQLPSPGESSSETVLWWSEDSCTWSVPNGEKFETDFSEKSQSLTDEERISTFNKHMTAGGFLDRYAANFGNYWGRRWLVAYYKASDVVFHNIFNINAR